MRNLTTAELKYVSGGRGGGGAGSGGGSGGTGGYGPGYGVPSGGRGA
jgi:hypothetical protein